MEKKSKPRIAFLGMGVIYAGLGQGIPVLNDLFNRLSHHFEIVFYSYKTIGRSGEPKTIAVKQVISGRIPGRLKYFLLFARAAFDHFFCQYDVIFAVSIYPAGLWAIRLGKILNRPVLIQLIGLEAVALPDIGYGNLAKPWLKKITKRVCEEADAIIMVADFQKSVAEKSLPTFRKIVVLPLRIDVTKFSYRKRIISGPVQFIHIAFYSPVKDQDTMFKAFAIVASVIDCHLTVVGDGFDVPKIHSMLMDLKINDKVSFSGPLPYSEIPQHFSNAHILLHTARFETGCAVIQEAMASGVAVCGTNVGILSDIGDRYAVIVPTQNAKELAEGILNLVNDPAKYDQITLDAYQWISQYDAVWSYQNYKALIDNYIRTT